MDTATIATVCVAVISSGGSVLAAYVARQVHHVRNNTAPISNGFAGDVTRRLERIELLITNHLEDHAAADVAARRRKPNTW